MVVTMHNIWSYDEKKVIELMVMYSWHLNSRPHKVAPQLWRTTVRNNTLSREAQVAHLRNSNSNT